MSKTRKRKSNQRRMKKTRNRKLRGGGVNCYNGKDTWSCSAQCGKDKACEKYD